MSGLEHVKDEAGNDIWFGDGGELRFPPGNHITDFKQQLKRMKTLQLRALSLIPPNRELLLLRTEGCPLL
nr:hypothetical protein BaRGS_027562 [Batillaria attramentaria]